MRRLIYAPKAYIFIRSSNMGIVYDVSADVTSGQVTQVCNDLSKATFTLRNRYRKWIRDPDTHQQIFLPMDMVTIWLQRIAGRPIQVFTGYLDAVPYYQALPGDAMFEASCTLKKLAFSWFDPGLPFFVQWANTNDGWIYTPDGNAVNPAYLQPDQALGGTAAITTHPGTTGTVSDGGFDALLGRFLTEVAGWSPDDVLISNLPKDLPKLAAQLYADVNKRSMADLKALETDLGQVMGVKGWSGVDPKSAQTNNGPAQNAAVMNVISSIKQGLSAFNVPILLPAFVAYVETAFDSTFEDETKNRYGLYAMTPDGHTAAAPGTGSDEPTIQGTSVSDISGDPLVATQVFCKKVSTVARSILGEKSPSLDQILAAAKATLGRDVAAGRSNTDLQKALKTVKQYCAAAVISTTPDSMPSVTTDAGSLTWTDLKPLVTDAEWKTIRNEYKSTKPWLAGILWRAKQVSNKITIARPMGKIGDKAVSLTGPPTALRSFYSLLNGDSSVDSVDASIDGQDFLLQNGKQSNLPNTKSKADNTMIITQNQQPSAQDAQTQSSSNTKGQAGISLSDLGTFSANAAFAAQFSFPADQIESLYLTGNRALMNDVSCLDGVKQFCQASLRSFRSLPDGRFLAFYPDYFGATRQAYWQVYDIEITNFGIQLNDQQLATHVYVVGDTFAQDGQISWQDKVSTRGVATVTQAFMLNSFIDTYQKTDPKKPLPPKEIGRLKDAYSFLKQYGARPYEEDQPLIRNVYYEFLIAWQRFMQKWSSQFATECTFTFQPEVMAGGLIAFPDHGVQMYCEQVVHQWDYTSGFSTTATLTAPSLMPSKRTRDYKTYPGFALGGNINTVGT